jgi:hypothetical protein
MFYCDRCRVRNHWPETMARSTGPCEVCGKTAVCHDTPSKYLPLPRVKDQETGRGTEPDS